LVSSLIDNTVRLSALSFSGMPYVSIQLPANRLFTVHRPRYPPTQRSLTWARRCTVRHKLGLSYRTVHVPQQCTRVPARVPCTRLCTRYTGLQRGYKRSPRGQRACLKCCRSTVEPIERLSWHLKASLHPQNLMLALSASILPILIAEHSPRQETVPPRRAKGGVLSVHKPRPRMNVCTTPKRPKKLDPKAKRIRSGLTEDRTRSRATLEHVVPQH